MATIYIGRKEGVVCGLCTRELHPVCHSVIWAEVYLRTKWHLDPSSRLATIHVNMGHKLGGAVPFFLGELGPHRTQSPGPRPTSISSGILVRPAGWHNGHWSKIGGCAALGTRSWVPIENNVVLAEAYLRTPSYPDTYIRLATIDMGRKLGGCALFGGGRSLVPI